MIKKLIMLILGIFITSYSLMFIIVYLNLLNMGYSLIDYLKYILTHIECLIIFMGILLIYKSIRKDKKHELYL